MTQTLGGTGHTIHYILMLSLLGRRGKIKAINVCISRLVKGDGEIIEEIVSKERQKAINKVCTTFSLHFCRSLFFF